MFKIERPHKKIELKNARAAIQAYTEAGKPLTIQLASAKASMRSEEKFEHPWTSQARVASLSFAILPEKYLSYYYTEDRISQYYMKQKRVVQSNRQCSYTFSFAMERPNYALYGDGMELVHRVIIKSAITKLVDSLQLKKSNI